MQSTILLFLLGFSIFYQNARVNGLRGSRVHRADPDEFPYIVAIVLQQDNPAKEKLHFCGGSLITRDIVLTAAHCISEIKLKDVQVLVGSVDIRKGKSYSIDWVLNYKTWAKENRIDVEKDYLENDIGVAKLTECVDENIKLATLSWDKKMTKYDQNVVKTAGWGVTENGITRRYLLTASLRVLSRMQCTSKIRELGFNKNSISKKNFCTQTTPYVILGCGDSGGPLVFNNEVIAVNSGVCPAWEELCIMENRLNAHAAVSKYKKFIEEAKVRVEKTSKCLIL